MRGVIFWTLVTLVITGINFIGWGLSNTYLLYDALFAIILGVIVWYVNLFRIKYKTQNTKLFLTALMCALLALPCLLHYKIIFSILDIVYTEKYSPLLIFVKSIPYSLKYGAFIGVGSFILLFLLSKVKNIVATKASGPKCKN